MLTPDDSAAKLAAIKARRDAVSQPAPWFRSRVGASGDATVRSQDGNRPIARVTIADHDMVGLAKHIEAWDDTHAGTQADAEFIAHAPADIDWLLERVEHLTQQLDDTRARLEAEEQSELRLRTALRSVRIFAVKALADDADEIERSRR